MKNQLNLSIDTIGHVVIGLGIALSLACAVAVVTLSPGLLDAAGTHATDVVRLEPVAVTISAARFDAIRAEGVHSTMLATR